MGMYLTNLKGQIFVCVVFRLWFLIGLKFQNDKCLPLSFGCIIFISSMSIKMLYFYY